MSSLKRRSSELLDIAQAFRAPPSVTDIAVRHFLSDLDTPRSLSVWLLYKNQEHDQLTNLECHAIDYENNPYRFRLDYIATNFLSKSKFLKTSFDLEKVALTKFHEYETLCHETNRRFLNPASDPLNHGPNVWLLNATKRKIAAVLGDYSPDEFVDEANWGPGVSTLVKGEAVSAINKFHEERGMTRDLYPLVRDCFSVMYPSWSDSLSRSFGENWQVLEVGNVIVTVPKNSKTNRVIAIEPGINLWFQKAIGSMIRRRLNRSGIDLQDQSINQRLARSSSLDDSLATVDFSSASDSISLEVVRELLPPRWFKIMDLCRSRFGVLDSGPIKWNKFSSMGNGFTFELESLIFFAAAEAVKEYTGSTGVISVYGDDVIIPSTMYNLFSSYSAFLGFRVNLRKSFSSGYFRESCGSHFYDGVDCKPIFLKEKLRHVEAFYKLANSIRNLAHRHNFGRGCDARFHYSWSHLVDRIPDPLRIFVPRSAGDTGLVGNFDEACPVRARYGIEGYYYRALSSLGVSRESESFAVLLARLRNPSTQEYGNTYTLRGRTKRSITRSLVQQWYNLGEWV
jgi:hypothetical protein